MNVLVFMPYLYDSAPSQRFRIEQWARVLDPQGVTFKFVSFESLGLRQVLYAPGQHVKKAQELLRCIRKRIAALLRLSSDADVIFLHRELLPVGPPLLEWMLARRGVPIVYDFDDSIFLSDASDANRRFAWLKWPSKIGQICELCTAVIAGNTYLHDYARGYTDRVSIMPTTIDTQAYLPKQTVDIHGIPTIGWSGSRTTVKHLKTLEATLRTLSKSLQFRLRVIGAKEYNIPGLDVSSQPWSSKSEVDDIRSFDIGIMPLPDDAWSRGKCGLKALQYMALGVPTIASPVGVNTEIIRDGHNGFLASTPEEWADKLTRLMSDESLRLRFSKEGRRTVEERYSAEVQAPRLLKILEAVRDRKPVCAA